MSCCLHSCPAWLGLAELPPVAAQPASCKPCGSGCFPLIPPYTTSPKLPANCSRNHCMFAGDVPGHLLEPQGPHQVHTVFEERRSISLCAVARICCHSLPGMAAGQQLPAEPTTGCYQNIRSFRSQVRNSALLFWRFWIGYMQ